MTSSTSYTGTATMYWNMSTESDMYAYFVYTGTATRQYDAFTSFTLAGSGTTAQPAGIFGGIPNGVLTYATVTAMDASFNESTYSAEVTLERQVPLIHLLRQFK
jgi:hypothetical protein